MKGNIQDSALPDNILFGGIKRVIKGLAVEMVDVTDLGGRSVPPILARLRHCDQGIEPRIVENGFDDVWVVGVFDHDVELLERRGTSVYVGIREEV